MTTPILSPPGYPILGHAPCFDKKLPMKTFMDWASQFEEIFSIDIMGRKIVLVNTYELVKELSDEKRFKKTIPGSILQVRNAVKDGLFTAYTDEPNWGLAHRLLMPAFGTGPVRSMFDDMLDVVSQLVLKWERFGPAKVDPAEDFTRLTFDTIALTAMSYRINSFYRETPHEFVQAMSDFLTECNLRGTRPAIVTAMMRSSRFKFEQDIKTMNKLVDEIIEDRKRNPIEKQDLLNIMLYQKDTKTGQGLPEDNIRHNLLTFLIAGHETTSGALTFALYHLLSHPEAMRKVREEVDAVLGDRVMEPSDLAKMPYILAVLRETLRLRPPAVVRTVKPYEDTTIGNGKYLIGKDTSVIINFWVLHRDKKIWGEDVEEFKPERMLDGRFETIPQYAWQPFGSGSRSCIGRALSIQESQIALACIFQKFDIFLDDPSYQLEMKQCLTVKPANLYIRVKPRADRARVTIAPSLGAPHRQNPNMESVGAPASAGTGGHPLMILYGSNTGSSQDFAQKFASQAARHGFTATLGTLDSVASRLPTDQPVIIFTASFEGEPADNAVEFVHWLEKLDGNEFPNLRFAVFGCGNREWLATYQRVPRLIDEKLGELGGQRLVERGESDAAGSAFFETFDAWAEELWKKLQEEYDTKTAGASHSEFGIEVTAIGAGTSRATALRQLDAALGTVLDNRLLTAPGAPAKRHIEFELPEGAGYRTGDYLAILPTNPPQNVQRVLKRFGLSPEQEITLSSSGPTSLPVGKPLGVAQLLSGYVELSQPATQRDVTILLKFATTPETVDKLKALSASFATEVAAKRLSILDILEDLPDIKLPFGAFIAILPSMRVRQYSISSSPLWNPSHVTLTVSILEAPPISGRSEPYLGVASNFLARLRPGDKVQVSVRGSAASFRTTEDTSVPIVMFCAGTGIAPMRGFMQERAMQKKAGMDVAKSLLFFGCRRPSEDFLYCDSDLKEWQELGIVDVRSAFSRSPEESAGCKYVQDRIWHDRVDLDIAFVAGAKLFTCGSRKVATGVKDILTAIIKEKRQVSDEEAAALFQQATVARYATDIFD